MTIMNAMNIGKVGSTVNVPETSQIPARAGDHPVLELLSGLTCSVLVVAAVACGGLAVGGFLPSVEGTLACLALLHAALLTGQYSHTGTWLPQNWNIVFWCVLGFGDGYAALTYFRMGHMSDGLAALLLCVASAKIIGKTIGKWRAGSPKENSEPSHFVGHTPPDVFHEAEV